MVLFVGRMETLKGIDDLLHAIAHILDDHQLPCNSVSLSVIGGSAEDNPDQVSAEMARLIRLRDELGLSEMVTFLGAQGQDVLPLYYSAADVVVMPSHYESFGMVALEAMACGTPVVASDVGGLSYTVEDGVTGFLVPDRDPKALADRICDILNDEVFRDQLGAQARQVALRYSWQRIAECIVDVYREVAPYEFRYPPAPLPYALAFLLFRIFDIWKPWPARWAERHVKGGLGIMLDDLFAAIYAICLLSVLLALGGVSGVRS